MTINFQYKSFLFQLRSLCFTGEEKIEDNLTMSDNFLIRPKEIWENKWFEISLIIYMEKKSVLIRK